MSAARTLRRKQTKERVTLPNGQVIFADVPGGKRRVKPGTRNRRLTVVSKPVAYPYYILYHATKGWRRRVLWRG